MNNETNHTTTQQAINNAAWSACDTFRGVMDAAGYKDYILVMLFLKYISDVWQDKFDEYRKTHGDDEARILRKLERERFVLPEDASFYALHAKRDASDIGEQINIALEAIETKNNKLEGVFRNIDFNSEANLGQTKDRNRRLKMLLEDFHKPALDMRPSCIAGDVIGDTYIYLIERFASDAGKKAGEFYTPHKVSQLVARLSQPKIGARICDPTCGSGGLLIEMAKAVGNRNYALYGMEVNGSTWALCRMNMFLHDADSARIEWCNTLTAPNLVEKDRLMKFDNIVANPPFSLDKWGAEQASSDIYKRFGRGTPPASKGDYAFISHMIEAAIEKQGRVAVVVPHGVLFRGGAEGRIREKLIAENLLDAVIGLSSNLFPTTSIPVAILIFDRSREKDGVNHARKDVLFIDASKDYQPGKNQNILRDDHLSKIVTAYQNRQPIAQYAHLADSAELQANGYNLNISRYVDIFQEEAPIDIIAVQQEINMLETQLSDIRTKMADILQDMPTQNKVSDNG